MRPQVARKSKRILKKETSFLFKYPFLFLNPNAVAFGREDTKYSAQYYIHPYPKFSGGGPGEASLRKRGSPEKIQKPCQGEEDQLGQGLVLLFFVVPESDSAGRESFLKIDNALVGGASEAEGDIVKTLNESAVNENVYKREHLICVLASGV